MKIKSFIVGGLSTNCYIVSDLEKEAIIIDPGIETHNDLSKITNYIKENSLEIKVIVNTHGHSDHISGNIIIQKKYNCPICIHEKDAPFLENLIESSRLRRLIEGDILSFGKSNLEIISTPGHTPGGISLVGEKVVFTGDTLFSKGIGRMDFPGGSKIDMKKSLKKIIALPEKYIVYPGHGSSSTIGEEKVGNPFLNWV
ncbi:MBL fold metallo-hydrolase [Candidatus Bathyarchaeota archaeon]|nr:MBL fold metallo-hydrolase [Candidatus Bathyarchaeota archaeon]